MPQHSQVASTGRVYVTVIPRAVVAAGNGVTVGGVIAGGAWTVLALLRAISQVQRWTTLLGRLLSDWLADEM
jgi:hypothetical protein